jgi:TRAP-type mannitol/chloroaromatic compound transport system substrate-binding protein
MERRRFLRKAALGTAASTALIGCGSGTSGDANGAPAVQTGQRLRWRLVSSFPRSAEIIYRGAEVLAERVSALTGGQFEIITSPAGEIVPPFQVLDAVQNRSVQMGHTASYYFTGKNPALAFDTGVPFGMTVRQQNAWMLDGDGTELTRRLFADFGVVNLLGGNTGTQMGGWFRRPVDSLADMRGLKMRIPGLGAQVMDRMGVNALSLPGGEIYQALERGAIDATEWIGPYDDEKLGFQRIVQHYYYPGWWEPGAVLSFYVNQSEWDGLPEAYRQILEVAALEVNQRMMAEYDAKNPPALQRLVDGGVQLHPFPDDVMQAARDAARDLSEEAAAADAGYRALYDSYRQFQQASDRWFATAEQAYADFTYRAALEANAS